MHCPRRGRSRKQRDATLGYALDSRFYGIGDFDGYLTGELAKLTLEDVNRAIRGHLSPTTMHVFMDTGDAGSLGDAIVSEKPSPITCNSPKPPAILEDVRTVPEEQIFR